MTALELLRDVLGRVIRAHEAIEDGDHDFAQEILWDLERELKHDLAPYPIGKRCGNCGAHFEWPGQLDDHYRWVHWGEPWKRAA